MSLTGARRVRVWAELLNASGQTLGTLAGFRGDTMTLNREATIRGQATVTVRESTQEIDWLTDRIGLRIDIDDATYEAGVYLPTAPDAQHGMGVTRQVQLLDRTHTLDRDDVGVGYSLPTGTGIVSAVVAQIQAAGEAVGAVTQSDKELRGDIVWEPETTRLRVVNDLLDAGGFFAIWTDPTGQFRIEPYMEPQQRGITWEFEAGRNCIHSPEWTRTQDLAGIRNIVTCISRSSGDEPALVSSASITDPTHPYNVTRIGPRATTETGIEVADQATLDAYATRRLRELSSATVTVEIEHAWLPGLKPNDAVMFDGKRHVVQSMRTDLSRPSLLTRTSLQEVADV